MQCNLKTLGLAGLRCRELYYNGKLQALARVPNADPARPLTGGFMAVYKESQDAHPGEQAGAALPGSAGRPRGWCST